MSSTSNSQVTSSSNDGGGKGDAFSLELVGDPSVEVRPPFEPTEHGLSKDFKFTKFGESRGKCLKLDRNELKSLQEILRDAKENENVDRSMIFPCEDTSVTKLEHSDTYLVETSDILHPIVDDPYTMGKIACASVLSGIYALGVAEVSNVRLFLGVSSRMELNDRNTVMPMVIRGFKDTAKASGTMVRGSQIFGNPWCLIGGTASTVCSHQHELVPPDGATIGDVIVLTKPLGTMLALTVSQWIEQPEKRGRLLLTITEEEVKKAYYRAVDSMVRTNRVAAVLMRKYNAHAACEVSSYGILGHAQNLARRQKNNVNFVIHNMPVIARMGSMSKITGSTLPLLQGTVPEVSGGLIVVLPREQAAAYCKALEKTECRQAWIVGIVEYGERTARIIDRPRVIEVPPKDNVLCSNRVSQMTKTYNDIEAVTRLLEEKEKDLELTARIGKELLTHNQKLETTVNALEAELKEANEKITQLNHELVKKTELIQILTNDVDESSPEGGTPTELRGINLDMMQRKIGTLEDENKQLRNEFSKLIHDTNDTEEQEARLVKDIAAQLANANMEVDGIAEELGRQKEENRLQHEQIISLTAKLAQTELRLAQLMAEHDEVGATLVITRDNQNTLASELAEFKDRYAEVVNLLAETQEQLRKQRKRGMPTVRGGSLFPSMGAAPQPDSIASELESSLYSELSLDSGIITDRTPTYKKVFETVRSASRASYAAADTNQFPRIGGSMTTSTLSSGSAGPRMSCGQIKPHAPFSFPSLDSTGHSDSEGSLLTDSEEYPGPQQIGVPGAPGAADLETALRRLTPAEVLARRACLSTGAGYNYDYDGGIIHSPPTFLPFGCRTPDSIMSTGSSGNLSGFSGNSGNAWRIPEKLQIVKPMEGSQTLHHWSQLATPTLGGLLEDRPGVRTRGGRGLEDLGLLTFTLSDLEEDEEYANPGKLFQDTGSVYTFTNSTVLHPDDHTNVTPSIVGSRVATAPSSALNSGMNTPRTLSRRNSTSTFSTTLGLAKMLNERGIKAVTPSCVATPSCFATPNGERNFTPTATPCNSPDASPPATRSASPPPESASLTFGLLSSGAELLKRTFSTESQPQPKRTRSKTSLSRSDKKALSGIRLVEKLERIGIDAIMATTIGSSISPLALQGALYTRRSTESPMAQLTFLKSSMSSSVSQEKLSSSSSSSVSSVVSEPTSKSTGSEDRTDVGSNKNDATRDISSNQRFMINRSLSARQRRAAGCKPTRPDLGQVKPAVNTPATKESATQSALGTISSLLFGRKGGLL